MNTSNPHPATSRRRRRWFSYSLRSLLLVTTLVGAVLGILVIPAERQRRAVAAILAIGEGVQYDFESGYPIYKSHWLSRWLGPDYFGDVVSVNFKPGFTDDGLIHLRGMTMLKRLYLSDTGVTDAGLVHLRGLTNLNTLDLRGTKVSDAGLTHLHGLTKLTFVSLRGTQVTVAGCNRLRRALPGCTVD